MRTSLVVVVLGALNILPTGSVRAADDNVAFIDQIGADNTGLITQLGSGNVAGQQTDPILQDGLYNELTLKQTGANNRIGLEGTGVDQIGSSATPTIFNEMIIDQNSDQNVVGSVHQAARGAIPQGANRLSIQQGLAGSGARNRITKVLQEQLDGMPGQIATLVQTGDQNTIDLVEQRSLTAAEFEENKITATFTGSYNGRGDFSGPALLSRAFANSLIQRIGYDALGANGNEMNLLVVGDFNRFGIFQGGRHNSVGLVTISGNSNQVGLRQDGLENDIVTSDLRGDSNRIGIGQIGTNRAFLTTVGVSSVNDILGLQEGTNDLQFYVDGDSNNLAVEQGYDGGLGGDNNADVSVTGDLNFLNVAQFGSNLTSVIIEGDLNNEQSALFGGDAQLGLLVGTLAQTGQGNVITATLIGDQNAIAMQQIGDFNTITATITGDANQAAFIQAGMLNTAWLVQSGNGNVAGFLQ